MAKFFYRGKVWRDSFPWFSFYCGKQYGKCDGARMNIAIIPIPRLCLKLKPCKQSGAFVGKDNIKVISVLGFPAAFKAFWPVSSVFLMNFIAMLPLSIPPAYLRFPASASNLVSIILRSAPKDERLWISPITWNVSVVASTEETDPISIIVPVANVFSVILKSFHCKFKCNFGKKAVIIARAFLPNGVLKKCIPLLLETTRLARLSWHRIFKLLFSLIVQYTIAQLRWVEKALWLFGGNFIIGHKARLGFRLIRKNSQESPSLHSLKTSFSFQTLRRASKLLPRNSANSLQRDLPFCRFGGSYQRHPYKVCRALLELFSRCPFDIKDLRPSWIMRPYPPFCAVFSL